MPMMDALVVARLSRDKLSIHCLPIDIARFNNATIITDTGSGVSRARSGIDEVASITVDTHASACERYWSFKSKKMLQVSKSAVHVSLGTTHHAIISRCHFAVGK